MKNKIQNPYPDNNCFFCGSENEAGLKLEFHFDTVKKEVSTKYLPDQHFVGQGNILHGGIQMGLLDEIMGWTSHVLTQEMAVTSDLNIKFVRPAYISKKNLNVSCRVISTEGKKVTMLATLTDNDGKICTEATGSFHVVSLERYNDLIQGK